MHRSMRNTLWIGLSILTFGCTAGTTDDPDEATVQRVVAPETHAQPKAAGSKVHAGAAHASKSELAPKPGVAITAAATAKPKRPLTETDAKLLLATALEELCVRLGDCKTSLATALTRKTNRVALTPSTSARLEGLAKTLNSSGDPSGAAAVIRSIDNVRTDLRAVSAIGISQSAIDQVIAGLLGGPAAVGASIVGPPSTIPQLAHRGSIAAAASAPTASAAVHFATSAAAHSPLGTQAYEYKLSLYAAVRGLSVATVLQESAEVCELNRQSPHLPSTQPNILLSGKMGGDQNIPQCSFGGTPIDTALDPSCWSFHGEDSLVYCVTQSAAHEYGGDDGPHIIRTSFAAAARRCEPCNEDGLAGTLRLMRNGAAEVTQCDTSHACRQPPDDPEDSCNCLDG